MRWLRGLLLFAVLGAVLLYGILFTLQNNIAVPIDLIVVRFPEQQLALWLFLAFALGSVLGIASSTFAVWNLRLARRLLRRQLKQQELELLQLRGTAAGIKR